MKFAEETFVSLQQTQQLLQIADELELFSPVDITVGKEEEKQYQISGLFQIQGEKLNKLSDEELLKLTKTGTLHLIYNHLDSSSNFENLITMNKS